jgi:hypothetical protein
VCRDEIADKDRDGASRRAGNSFMRHWLHSALVSVLSLTALATSSAGATEVATPASTTASIPASDNSAAVTPLEMKWLRAGWSVLSYAEEQQLPIDIVVQPKSTPGDVPFSMHVDNGRCQLVLSMRGNPAAEAVLDGVPVEVQALAIEAMTAHEVAHCWRYMNGMWHALPASFIENNLDTGNTQLAALQRAMRDTRREEGFADLVGLAWTLRAHPDQYAVVHAWFERVRADQPTTGGHHDTRIWLKLAAQPQDFPVSGTPFEQAQSLWVEGLRNP